MVYLPTFRFLMVNIGKCTILGSYGLHFELRVEKIWVRTYVYIYILYIYII